jgi:hypothetical protein
MTIPKRLNEIIEEQLAAKQASDLTDAAVGLSGAAALEGGLDPVADAGALGADAAVGAEEAAPVVEDAASGLWNSVKDLGSSAWSGLKGLAGAGGAVQGIQDVTHDAEGALGVGDAPYEGEDTSSGSSSGSSGVGSVRVGPMLTSSKKHAANNIEMEILNQVKDIPKLLEMILENICGCGQPTPGKFNGMPHCTPGTGCADNVAFSKNNPNGDNCCSCGNPNCSGSFHGQPICAPGQGCNDHWDAEKGARKSTPSFIAPAINDGDSDEDDLPTQTATTWE